MEYELETVDGNTYRICMLKVTLEELLKHVNLPEHPKEARKRNTKFFFLRIILVALLALAINYITSCVTGRKCEICDDYIVSDYYYNDDGGETEYYCESCYKRYNR